MKAGGGGRARKGAAWVCPRCERGFAEPNKPHACGPWTVAGFLADKDPRAQLLFQAFQRLVERCGFISVVPGKRRVYFQARHIFAGVDALHARGMDAHIVLARRLEHARFTSIEPVGPRHYVHRFRVRGLRELDREVMDWLEEAYAVGMVPSLEEPQPRSGSGLAAFRGPV